MIENFLLGLIIAEFLTNWLFFRGGVGVSYFEDGDSAADLGSKPGVVVPGSSLNIVGFIPEACGLSLCNSGFGAGIAGLDDTCPGFDETPIWLLCVTRIGLGPRAVWA